MVFAIDMERLREHPFASVQGEPGEIRKGDYRFEAYFRLDLTTDTIQVDIREVEKTPKADDSLFRSDLKKMEENNLRFFGGGKKKGNGHGR